LAAALSVPKRFVLANLGTPHFNPGSGLGDPGNFKTFVSDVAPAGKIRNITQVIVTCGLEGYFQILVDSAMVGSGMTGPGNHTVPFYFDPPYPVNAGSTIEIQFRQRKNTPPVQVDVFLQSTDVIP